MASFGAYDPDKFVPVEPIKAPGWFSLLAPMIDTTDADPDIIWQDLQKPKDNIGGNAERFKQDAAFAAMGSLFGAGAAGGRQLAKQAPKYMKRAMMEAGPGLQAVEAQAALDVQQIINGLMGGEK
jgi:hypothetical protein